MTDLRTALRWGAWVSGGMTLLVFLPVGGARHGRTIRASRHSARGLSDQRRDLGSDGLPVAGRRFLAAVASRHRRPPAGIDHRGPDLPDAGRDRRRDPHPARRAAAHGDELGRRDQRLGAARDLLGPEHRGGVLWLAAPMVLAMVGAAAGGTPAIVLLTARALGILGLQVPVAVAMRALDRSADAATALRLKQEAIRTDRVVAETLLHDRLRRSQSVATVVEPVLAVLAERGAEANSDDTLRRRCGVAAAQVRRMLAEWHRTGPDPLGDDLTLCLDQVQAAGLRVDVAVHATPHAELPAPLQRIACEVVRALTCDLGTRLRVTVLATTTHLCVSIVARSAGGHARRPPATVPAPLTIRTTIVGDSIWVELTCPL